MKNRQHIAFIGLFLLIMLLPYGLWLLKLDIKIDIKENRTLAASPSYKNDISKFNKQLDQYINDNMHLRTYFISWYHYIWGWQLYSPVSPYIRGKDNNLFPIGALKSATMRTYNPDVAYNEIVHGMYYLSRYYNSDFMYILLPDKESVMPSYMPEWTQNFKRKHNILSLRELFLSQVNEPMFTFIDLCEYMASDETGAETYFDKRVDVAHYNGKGVKLVIDTMCEEFNKDKQVYNCSDMSVNLILKTYKWHPYHFKYGYEDTVRASKISDISELEKIPYGKKLGWKSVNYRFYKIGK